MLFRLRETHGYIYLYIKKVPLQEGKGGGWEEQSEAAVAVGVSRAWRSRGGEDCWDSRHADRAGAE